MNTHTHRHTHNTHTYTQALITARWETKVDILHYSLDYSALRAVTKKGEASER